MFTRSRRDLDELEGEVQALDRSLQVLKAAVKQAAGARDDTNADLTHVQGRLAAKTAEALPGDDAIRKRLDAAIESAVAAARQALTARWTEIVQLLTDACRKVDGELTERRRRLARLRDEVDAEQRRQRQATG